MLPARAPYSLHCCCVYIVVARETFPAPEKWQAARPGAACPFKTAFETGKHRPRHGRYSSSFDQIGCCPSPLLSVHLHPAPPVSAHTRLRLPCPIRAELKFDPTQGTLIKVLRFNHQAATPGTGYHSGSNTPCPVILVLHHGTHVSQDRLGPGLWKAGSRSRWET